MKRLYDADYSRAPLRGRVVLRVTKRLFPAQPTVLKPTLFEETFCHRKGALALSFIIDSFACSDRVPMMSIMCLSRG